MASKKEHRRKKKRKGKSVGERQAEPSFLPPGMEINSLDLLSLAAPVPVSKAAGQAAKKDRPEGETSCAPDGQNSTPAPAEGTSPERAAEIARMDAALDGRRKADAACLSATAGDRRDAMALAAEQALVAASEETARLRRIEEEQDAARCREERERRIAAEQEVNAAREREEATARRVAEEAEARRMEEEAQRRRMEEEAAARRETEEAEARRLAEEAQAKRVAEEADKRHDEAQWKSAWATEMRRRAARATETGSSGSAAADPADAAMAASAAPPPLEIENPFWERSPEIFDVLSGAPHGMGDSGAPAYVRREEPAMAVTMTRGLEGEARYTPFDLRNAGQDESCEPSRMIDPPRAVPPEKRMYIVMVTPEVAPCAKVGGLGDVILGLGRELMKRGHGVEVICPMYSGMRYDLIEDLHEEYSELWCPHYDQWHPEKVFQGKVEGGLQVNFITGGGYFERPNIYGYEDDLQRFTYFSRAALEFMFKTNRRPEIIHCHDWATGLVPAILWDIYEKLGWNNSRCVYTIHNNECQGLCGFGDKLLGMVGLNLAEYLRPDRMQDDTHKNCINMMKGGIVYSNFVTTVSPTYAGELKTAAGGRGLQHTIAKNSAKVGGVLNGIDYDSWNPATDDKLTARYSAGEDFFEKYRNKTALREWLGLWDAWKPIVSVVTRLTHQKGLDLIRHAVYACRDLQAQFVLLGSAPDPKVNESFLRMQYELRDNHDVNLYIGYHEDLSRLIYAGSDMFLVPSLYEPCGLTQMISLRYGTVPIVRETGGLIDSVFDLDNSGKGLSEANGFTFRDPTPESLDYGLTRAVRLWYDNPEAFNRLARNGMAYDYSWRHPAEHYENIYLYIKA